MNGINQVTLKGHLARDGETKTMRDGETRICNFSVATNRSYKNKAGEWTKTADFHRCVAWYPDPELTKKMLKGAAIFVQGRLQTRSWDDPSGNGKRYVTEVVCKGSDVDVLSPPLKKDGESGKWQRPPPEGGEYPF